MLVQDLVEVNPAEESLIAAGDNPLFGTNTSFKSMWIVYVIQSERVSRRYIGITTDINKRLASHNRGATKATKAWIPWRLVFTEHYQDRDEAVRREKYLKSGSGREFLDSSI